MKKSKSRSKKTNKSISKKIPIILIKKSDIETKKLAVIIGNKTINFGAKGYSDYNHHQNLFRKYLYENRHRKRENWTKSGITTAGFWSKWILWNKPSLIESIKDTEKRFNIKIINKI